MLNENRELTRYRYVARRSGRSFVRLRFKFAHLPMLRTIESATK